MMLHPSTPTDTSDAGRTPLYARLSERSHHTIG